MQTFFRAVVLFIIAFGFTVIAQAISKEDIVFPIAELGNCANKEACKAHCDQEENFPACIAFAKKHNLLSQKEIERAEKVLSLSNRQGPGGCQGMSECRAYCEDVNHFEECITFARRHGLMKEEELEEAEKVMRAVREGATLPGGCTSKEQCEAYCKDEAHLDECVEFGRRAGFISEKEYELIKKTRGRGPGECRGERECKAYCEVQAHVAECIAFAKEHGLMSEEEAEIVMKTSGKGPGGCQGEACREYCNDEAHFEECLAFVKEHDLISQEEYERAKRTGGRGPGGCNGEEECRRYCQDPANQAECEAFFETVNGEGMSGEGVRQEATERQWNAKGIPPEVHECLERELGEELARKLASGEIEPGREIGDTVRACFEEFGQTIQPEDLHQEESTPSTEGEQPDHTREETPPPVQFQGPGGCSTPEECQAYCSDPEHHEECMQFRSTQTKATVKFLGAALFQVMQMLLGN